MILKKQEQIPSLLERYESKFIIPQQMVGPVSEFVSIYCRADKYSEKTVDGFYTVNNLYFDSPDYLFLKKRLDGSENRFNMRIRTYDNHSKAPCFFEIKQKKGGIVRKYRAAIFDINWQKVFEIPGYTLNTGGDKRSESNANLFVKTACTYGATPKVLTQYKRIAYVSMVDNYARVTFDKALRFQVAKGYRLTDDENKMVPYDDATVFDREESSIIMELKCYASQVPLWMMDLVRTFNLCRIRFSKYVTGVTQALNLFGYDRSHTIPVRNV